MPSAVFSSEDTDSSTISCHHCRGPILNNRGRGLCRQCHNNEKIRKKYPILISSLRTFGRDWEYDSAPRPNPSKPTKAKPKSEEKIRVMIERLERGEELHHPQDAGSKPRSITESLVEMQYALIKGVYLDKDGRWRAYPADPSRGGRHKHLGYFLSRAEACLEIVEWVKAGRPSDWKPKRISENAGIFSVC